MTQTEAVISRFQCFPLNWSGLPRPETPLFDCGEDFLSAGREGMATGEAYRATSR